MTQNAKSLSLLFAAILVQTPFAGCGRPEADPERKPAQPMAVRVTTPRHGPITRFVTLPGQIKPYQQATLYAKVAGYLRTINVDKGDRIKQDMLLAEIEVPELIAQQAKHKAEVEVADIDFKRLNESQKKAPDLVVPQTVDEARGRLAVAKANLAGTETLLNYSKIRAPFSGIITRRFVDPGAFIPAASAASTPQSAALVTLTDLDRVRLQVAVPEIEAPLIALGQPTKLSVEGIPGKNWDGEISRYSYALDEDTRTMLAEIELPNPNLELRPGMYATVKIGIERRDDVMLIPAQAVVTEKSGSSVFVVVEKHARKTRVELGFSEGMNVEVTKGLDANQPVILIGKQDLKDGEQVTVVEAK